MLKTKKKKKGKCSFIENLNFYKQKKYVHIYTENHLSNLLLCFSL